VTCIADSSFRFPHLESPFNAHPFRHVTIPFFINGHSHHSMQSGFTRALFLQVSIINCDRIQSHIYSPSFHISFILISQVFLRPFKLPVLDHTTSIHLNRSSFVRSYYICVRADQVLQHVITLSSSMHLSMMCQVFSP